MQHGRKAPAAEGHHVTTPMADADHPGAHQAGKSHQAPGQQLSDACVIACLGTPVPWPAAGLIAPAETGQPVTWRLTATTHEGRLTGPGFRPPISI